MFIKGYGGSLFNIDHIVSIFYGNQTGNVRAETMNGRNVVISDTMTSEEGRICLELIAKDIEIGKDVIVCPDADRIKAEINKTEGKWHHETGKKTKGHGRS